jgi:two-component system cell cycle response regulator DivK
MSASVLIVDPSAENREVLRTVLASRGLRILEADAAEPGLALAREHHPDVIVLDVETTSADAEQCRLAAASPGHSAELIMLGKLRRGEQFAGGHVISKPYHFAPLVHTIERLAAKAA